MKITSKKVELSDGSFYFDYTIDYRGFRYSEGLFGNSLVSPENRMVYIRGMAPRDWEAAKKHIEAAA